jgi:hypothetical protein
MKLLLLVFSFLAAVNADDHEIPCTGDCCEFTKKTCGEAARNSRRACKDSRDGNFQCCAWVWRTKNGVSAKKCVAKKICRPNPDLPKVDMKECYPGTPGISNSG